jgi:hypothetical protein
MSGFVNNASWTRHFAISEITEIGKGVKRSNGWGYVHTAKLRDGTDIALDGHEADRLIDNVMEVIPAKDGYCTIETGNCLSGEPYTHREPVLAWQVLASGEMRPLTIRGPNNGELFSIAVEQPSGEIWCPLEDAIYHDFDAFREAEIERREREDADIAARQAEKGASA